MEGLALDNLASGVGVILQAAGQVREARFLKGYQFIEVRGLDWAAEYARWRFGKNC
jgi:hypothetical protein